MSRDYGSNSGAVGFLAGAVLGGVIGAGVALLLAPQSGKETRAMLKRKAREVGEDVKEFRDDIGPRVKDFKKNLGPRLDDARDSLVKRFQR